MTASLAHSPTSGNPRSRASSRYFVISCVSRPRRRCVGRTLTIVRPAHGSEPPPGMPSCRSKLPAVATICPRSNTPHACDSGNVARNRASPSGSTSCGSSPNVVMMHSRNAVTSLSVIARSSITRP
jgi:hypothetical protein